MSCFPARPAASFPCPGIVPSARDHMASLATALTLCPGGSYAHVSFQIRQRCLLYVENVTQTFTYWIKNSSGH